MHSPLQQVYPHFFVEHLSGSQTMTVSVSSLNGSWLEVSCHEILPMHSQKT